MIVHPDRVDEFSEPLWTENGYGDDQLYTGLEVAQQEYTQMINNGVPIEEARQVLPNACAVNYLWTIDARNLYFFLRQRMCKRNVTEMQTFAKEVWGCLNNYWPELAECCGPYCHPTGKCNQGRMSCGDPYKPENK